VHNTETGESLWKFPDDVLKKVIDLDRLLREGKPIPEDEEEEEEEEVKDEAKEEDSSEYEEIEVTDNEDEDDDGGVNKRLRTEESEEPVGPVEFGQDDFEFEMMDEEEYDPEDELTEEDCRSLFFDLLEDFKISPYSTFDQVLDDGKIIEDSRYTALPNMKSRRTAWDDWSMAKIQQLKETRETQQKLDPRIGYFALLQDHASTKLYWPEFKKKYRKDEAMKTLKIADKDREKWYREHVKRLQMPNSQLKADLKELLKAQPLSVLNRNTSVDALPVSLLTNVKYISLPPKSRDALVETFISTLPPPGDDEAEKAEEKSQASKDRDRRERALAEREKRIEEQKKQQMRDLRYGRNALREEEEQLDRAFSVGNRGLKSQFEE
jgi:hypothetical protein